MNISMAGSHANETKFCAGSKVTALNPNAAEFVPFALRSPSSSTISSVTDGKTKVTLCGTLGKSVLDRSESSISKNSDEEAHQYWFHQLPDDITPDFNVINENESQHQGSLSLAGLSLHDNGQATVFPSSIVSGYLLNEQRDFSTYGTTKSFVGNLRQPSRSSYEEDMSSASILHIKPWERKFLNSCQLLNKSRDGSLYDGKSKHGLVNDAGEQTVLEDTAVNPMKLLASQFPGFPAERLAEVYFGNGCDLNLTIEMLAQLELQGDGNFNQNRNQNTLFEPNLTATDFPELPSSNGLNGSFTYSETDFHPYASPFSSSDKDNMIMVKLSSSLPSKGAVDSASAVRKLASNDSALWKYENKGFSDAPVGSSRNSQNLTGTYTNGNGTRGVHSDRVQNNVSSWTAPLWLETGDAAANMYSEQREEALDHARLRNAYFDQARQAYLIGNKALAKQLSVKGQLHNMQMKAVHGKAQAFIFRQRNPTGATEAMGDGRGPERMIDLHGLHVSEALHVLKHELGVLRNTARITDQRLQVYICVGTGHHTRGSRTPARHFISVQRYLLEEEGLDFSEPQPGLLRVVIY